MAIASITTWLNSPEKKYILGRMLYEQYGDKSSLKALFKSGDSNFHFTKLVSALEELNKLNNPPPKQIIIAEPAPKNILKEKPLLEYEGAPEKIVEIRNNKNKAYSLARKLFEMIPYMDSPAHRLEAGKELLQKMIYVQDCWQAIDEWKANGTIRELKLKEIEKDVADLTLAELRQEEKNLPPNISKDRGKLKVANDPAKQLKLSNRIQERQKRLEHVKRRLNELI